MLTTSVIEDLIYMRLSDAEAATLLKSLTPETITASVLSDFMAVMLKSAQPVPELSVEVMDCCGTGGSGLSRFNTSTAVAFVLASAGVRVVKFGNRAMSSVSGSFDFLAALGFPLEIPLTMVEPIVLQSNVAFVFAPQCYPHLARLSALRRTLGVQTVFNFLGPLLNPFKPSRQLVGVSNAHMQSLMAQYLLENGKKNGVERALLLRAESGLDECDPTLETHVTDVNHGVLSSFSILPTARLSSPLTAAVSLLPADSAATFLSIIAGDDSHSDAYQLLCANAGVGLYVAGKAPSIEAGVKQSAQLIATGAVLDTLNKTRRAYAEYS